MSNELIVNEEVEAKPQETVEPETKEAEVKLDRVDSWSEDEAKKNYRELEQFNSRQAQELGNSRKLIDQFNQMQPEPSKEVTIDLDSLLDNPTDTINKSLQNNPAIQKLQNDLQTIQNSTAIATIESKHPDYMETYQDPAFQNWATDNPIRQRLLSEANNYDVDAADYLFSEWNSHTSTSKQAAEDNVRIEKAKADIGKAASEGAGGQAATKIYSRHDLAELQLRDSDKYHAMWPEIYKAYQEGRVR